MNKTGHIFKMKFISANGCESNTQTDVNNCGNCGNACGSGANAGKGNCQAGTSYGIVGDVVKGTCTSGAVCCGYNAANPSASPNYCSATRSDGSQNGAPHCCLKGQWWNTDTRGCQADSGRNPPDFSNPPGISF